MIVFRVETSKQVGMYFGGSAAHKMCGDRHPGPRHDDRLMTELRDKGLKTNSIYDPIDQSCVFGFASKKQMRNWVHKDEWKEALAKEGLMVAAYEVPKAHVAIGHTQVVFKPQVAKLLSRMCPTKI